MEFYRHPLGKNGLHPRCKPCFNLYTSHRKNEIAAYNAARYKQNRDVIRAQHKAYSQRHKKEEAAQQLAWRIANKEHVAAVRAAYRAANKKAVAAMVPRLVRLPLRKRLDDEMDAIAVGLTCLASIRVVG